MASLIAMAGFMGSGKSSVGREVASRMGYRFVDLDNEFLAQTGVSIADYFKNHGEESFRRRETQLVASVIEQARGADTILALGGGTLGDPVARSQVKRGGRVITLAVEASEAWNRVAGSERPLAVDPMSFKDLHASRRSTYEEAADWLLPVGSLRVPELSDRICDVLRKTGDDWPRLWGRWLSGTSRSSVIVGGSGALRYLRAASAEALGEGRSLHLITDSNVLMHWGSQVSSILGGLHSDDMHVIEPGEASKDAKTLIGCWEWLAQRNSRRQDIVVALGGGVVGDLAGLVASTYHRGVQLWQIPTSLLAQVDSSVGGKTAINLREGKNLVGTFYQPDLVVIDPATLQTLPDIDYAGALGEVTKHALLRSEDSLAWLEQNAQAVALRDESVLGELLRWNVFLKASVVEADERESGQRAILNLGHTVGHALENCLGYGALGHGRAVALGLLVSLAISEQLLGLDESVRRRVRTLFQGWGVDPNLELPSTHALFDAVAHDKKASTSSSGFVGLRRPGDPVTGLDVDNQLLTASLEVIAK